jgi:hypothetical protein
MRLKWGEAFEAYDKWVSLGVSRKTNNADKLKWCTGYVYAKQQEVEKLNATHKKN